MLVYSKKECHFVGTRVKAQSQSQSGGKPWPPCDDKLWTFITLKYITACSLLGNCWHQLMGCINYFDAYGNRLESVKPFRATSVMLDFICDQVTATVLWQQIPVLTFSAKMSSAKSQCLRCQAGLEMLSSGHRC